MLSVQSEIIAFLYLQLQNPSFEGVDIKCPTDCILHIASLCMFIFHVAYILYIPIYVCIYIIIHNYIMIYSIPVYTVKSR